MQICTKTSVRIQMNYSNLSNYKFMKFRTIYNFFDSNYGCVGWGKKYYRVGQNSISTRGSPLPPETGFWSEWTSGSTSSKTSHCLASASSLLKNASKSTNSVSAFFSSAHSATCASLSFYSPDADFFHKIVPKFCRCVTRKTSLAFTSFASL